MKKVVLISISCLLLIISGVVFYVLTDSSSVSLLSPLQPTPTAPPPTPTIPLIVKDQERIKSVVNAFYEEYLVCLKNPPPAERRTAQVYCREKSTRTSEDFLTNIKATRGSDPVLCSATAPSSVTYESVDFESPERANVIMVALFGGFAEKHSVFVIRDGIEWRVDEISCLTP